VKILAADTALGACSAALVEALAEETCVLAEEALEMSRGHAEALAPMVDRVMRRASMAFASLDRLAVTTGPGTFTGQRVGLAFMRALALALKIPLIGITTLDAMAEAALDASPSSVAWAIAAADAKRGEIYLGARSRDGGLLEPMLVAFADAPAKLAPFFARIGNRAVLAGTASPLLMPLLPGGLADSGIRQPHARHVAFLAAQADAGATPKPLYLRAPDAKLPGSA
jgi:tRNA threonylcarbamoyladenosine biosynthesis protein TsaB